jgi:hypothetical protein
MDLGGGRGGGGEGMWPYTLCSRGRDTDEELLPILGSGESTGCADVEGEGF